jgi:hypothetical protein
MGPQLELTYEPALDRERLSRLLGAVLQALRSGAWLTLAEIRERAQHGSEAGISARIRELRDCGFVIERRRRGNPARGWWEYRMTGGRFRVLPSDLRQARKAKRLVCPQPIADARPE